MAKISSSFLSAFPIFQVCLKIIHGIKDSELYNLPVILNHTPGGASMKLIEWRKIKPKIRSLVRIPRQWSVMF